MIVADSNLIAYLYVGGIWSSLARQVLLQDPHWGAPLLWRSELRNTLVKSLRSGAVEPGEAFRIMTEAESLMSGGEYHVVSADVLNLAASSGCTAYDAEFVALARGLSVPLVTTDRELLEKFPETAVTPEGFLAGGG